MKTTKFSIVLPRIEELHAGIDGGYALCIEKTHIPPDEFDCLLRLVGESSRLRRLNFAHVTITSWIRLADAL